MNLIVIHKNNNSPTSSNNGLLRFGISSQPIASVILDGLSKNLCLNGVLLPSKNLQKTKRNPWFIISNGRFATQINTEFLYKVLASARADVVTVNVESDLLAYREKVRLTAQGEVAGFRRLYSDFSEPAPFPSDWPHHIFIKTNVLNQVLADRTLCQSFSALIERCRLSALTLCAIRVGGTVFDLDTRHRAGFAWLSRNQAQLICPESS